MEAIKGLARRATQSVRDNLSTQHVSEEEKILSDITAKVHQYERAGLAINDKLGRISRLYGELGQLLREIAEEYNNIPDKFPETEATCTGLLQASSQLVSKGAEFQNTLKEHSQNPISMFLKEIPKLKDVEEDRGKKKLEYEFFKAKVLELRKDPPKDSTRIPRNEQILENWRVELWKATETNKAAVSALYSQGKQVIDRSVLVLIQTTGNFVHSSAGCLKQHLFNIKLPVYPQGSVLLPSPLPPNPLPPFQQPILVSGPVVAQWQAPGGWASPAQPVNPQAPQQQWAVQTPAHHLPPGTQPTSSYQAPYQQAAGQVPVTGYPPLQQQQPHPIQPTGYPPIAYPQPPNPSAYPQQQTQVAAQNYVPTPTPTTTVETVPQ